MLKRVLENQSAGIADVEELWALYEQSRKISSSMNEASSVSAGPEKRQPSSAELYAAAQVAGLAADYILAAETCAQFLALAPENQADDVEKYYMGHFKSHKLKAEKLAVRFSSLLAEYEKGIYPDTIQRAAPDGKQPYIFVILLDALRADHLGAYGYSKNTSPFIDSLAARGIMFEMAFSQAPVTQVSVASLFTGSYPYTHKLMTPNQDWLYEKGLIDVFRKAGYRTGAFTANAALSPDMHYDEGFDHFAQLDNLRPDLVFSEAASWFEQTARDNSKIFSYIHLFDPHDVYMPLPPFLKMFSRMEKPPFISYAVVASLKSRELHCGFNREIEHWDEPQYIIDCLRRAERLPPDLDMQDILDQRDLYDGEIRSADSALQRFFEKLQSMGVLEDSLFVIISDHGESFLEHNQIHHNNVVYDNEIHVPMIFWRGKNNFGGKKTGRQVELIDTLPTIMAMTGIKAPKRDGGNALAFVRRFSPDRIFSMTEMPPGEKTRKAITVRYKDYKLVYRTDDDITELYDLEKDPGELKNVCEVLKVKCKQMKKVLLDWKKRTDIKSPRPVKKGLNPEIEKKMKEMGYLK